MKMIIILGRLYTVIVEEKNYVDDKETKNSSKRTRQRYQMLNIRSLG